MDIFWQFLHRKRKCWNIKPVSAIASKAKCKLLTVKKWLELKKKTTLFWKNFRAGALPRTPLGGTCPPDPPQRNPPPNPDPATPLGLCSAFGARRSCGFEQRPLALATQLGGSLCLFGHRYKTSYLTLLDQKERKKERINLHHSTALPWWQRKKSMHMFEIWPCHHCVTVALASCRLDDCKAKWVSRSAFTPQCTTTLAKKNGHLDYA